MRFSILQVLGFLGWTIMTVVISVYASSRFLSHQNFSPAAESVAGSIVVKDQKGNVRIRLGVSPTNSPPGSHPGENPTITFYDEQAHPSLTLGLDGRGDGAIVFANEYHPGVALLLGHQQMVDDGTESRSRAVEDTTGARGLFVNGPHGGRTQVAFANAGIALGPLQTGIKGTPLALGKAK